jgi:hypothetical protein
VLPLSNISHLQFEFDVRSVVKTADLCLLNILK